MTCIKNIENINKINDIDNMNNMNIINQMNAPDEIDNIDMSLDVDKYAYMSCENNKKKRKLYPGSKIEPTQRKIMNKLRDGVYSPPQVINKLKANSCTEWECLDSSGFETHHISMRHTFENDVFFECNCNKSDNNVKTRDCKHIVGVILKIGLNQANQVGAGTTKDVLKMFKLFSL
jgi:hypothetical protein